MEPYSWNIASGRKRLALIFAGLTTAVALGLIAVTGLEAGAPSAEKAALVISDSECWLLDGNAVIVSATSSHAVDTRNSNENRVLKCSVKGVANSTGKAAHFDFKNTGLLCDVGVLTDKWHNKVSKSGNATLTCFVR